MNRRQRRFYDLVQDLPEVIEAAAQEVDDEQILSTLGFCSAVICHEERDMSAQQATRCATAAFQNHMRGIGAFDRAKSDPVAQTLVGAGSGDRRDPEIIEGIRRGEDVRKVLEDAKPNVALIGMQSALTETILSLDDMDHGAVATGCANAIRMAVLRRSPWETIVPQSDKVHSRQ